MPGNQDSHATEPKNSSNKDFFSTVCFPPFFIQHCTKESVRRSHK